MWTDIHTHARYTHTHRNKKSLMHWESEAGCWRLTVWCVTAMPVIPTLGTGGRLLEAHRRAHLASPSLSFRFSDRRCTDWGREQGKRQPMLSCLQHKLSCANIFPSPLDFDSVYNKNNELPNTRNYCFLLSGSRIWKHFIINFIRNCCLWGFYNCIFDGCYLSISTPFSLTQQQ